MLVNLNLNQAIGWHFFRRYCETGKLL